MNKLIIFSLIKVGWTTTYCQDTSVTSDESIRKIIKEGIEAYNNQDWARVKKGYSENVKVYEFPNTLRNSTADDLISRYPKTFAKYPKNKAEIFDIYIVGNKAICKERITGRGEPFYTTLIYKFANDKITNIWFISNSPTMQRPKN